MKAIFRDLASHDKITRDKGVTQVEQLVVRTKSLTETEYLKIWKALFYCFWHSDGVAVQQELAHRLAKIQHALPAESFIPWIAAFWKTINREWSGIDKLRLDKYYSLVRFFVRQTFLYLSQAEWEASLMEEWAVVMNPLCRQYFLCRTDGAQVATLKPEEVTIETMSLETPNEGPFSFDTKHGLQYHVLELYIEELEGALGETPIYALSPETIISLLVPVLHLLAFTKERILLKKLYAEVFDALHQKFAELLQLEIEEDQQDTQKLLIAFIRPFSEVLWNIGTSSLINNSNRAAIYRIRLPLASFLDSLPSETKPKKRKNTDQENKNQVYDEKEVEMESSNNAVGKKKIKEKKQNTQPQEPPKKKVKQVVPPSPSRVIFDLGKNQTIDLDELEFSTPSPHTPDKTPQSGILRRRPRSSLPK